MKIYSHENLSLHRPLPYFSYGKMHEPLEIPERMVELLKAPCAVTTEGFTVLAQKLKALNKPLIVLVEGGYYLQKLNDNLQAFLSGLISED